MDYKARVLGENVLIKQTMKKKKGKLILDGADKDEDKFDFSFEIVQLGDTVTAKISVGEYPVFGKYVNFNPLKILEKNENGMSSLLVVHQNDIIGIDEDAPKLDISSPKADTGNLKVIGNDNTN